MSFGGAMKVAESKVVAAIDFGTTFSGFAFALRSKPEKVHQFFEWPGQDVSFVNYCKTVTTMLYQQEAPHVESWGWPAYNTGRDTPETAHLYCERFKLHLAEQKVDDLPPLPYGKTAEEAIGDFLRAMFEFAFPIIRKELGDDIKEQDIQWCLTVPAIWTDKAKAIMKRAAQRAGMINGPLCRAGKGSRHELIIVYEPEAASLYCYKTLKDKHLDAFSKPFLICDIGGGTVDLVVHEFEQPPEYLAFLRETRLRELTMGTGGICGGAILDKNFKNLLRKKLPKMPFDGNPEVSVLDVLEKKYPKAFGRLMKTWEQVKRGFSGTEHMIVVDFPKDLRNLIKNCSRTEDADDDDEEEDSDDESDHTIPRDELYKEVFDPILDAIKILVAEQLVKVEACKTIVLVGGFSESKFLQESIKKFFEGHVTNIIAPPSPGSAVVAGAVMYGMSPASIVSRCARHSYGLKTARLAEPKDPPGARFTENGRQFTWVFEKFVKVGQEVRLDSYERKQYNPLSASQKCIDLPIYRSDDPDAVYANDKNVEFVGTLSIPVEQTVGYTPTVEVRFKFGGTTIEVTARNITRGTDPVSYEIPFV